MLLEVDGKLVVGKSEPDPLRCPNCHRFFSRKVSTPEGENLRCIWCAHQSAIEEFEAKFVELAPVRLLAYY